MYILPIVGIIGEPSEGEENLPHFRFTDLLMHLNAAKNEQVIHLIINSDGGDVEEGDKMRSALQASGKTFISSNSGNVASMAVTFFMMPKEKENRKFDPAKGVFLIHNPWGVVEGDAELMNEASKYLKTIENNLAKEYAAATGSDLAVLTGFMSENTPLTPEQVDSLGFATIVKQEFKAVAKFNINKNKMEVKELNEKVTIMEKAFEKFASLFKEKPKSLMIQDTNGAEIDFGEAVETTDQIQIGLTATVDGSPAEGEYVLEDGTIYVFAGGELTEIKEAEVEDVEALKKENADLKTELETLKSTNDEAVAKLETENVELKAKAKKLDDVEKEFTEFKNQFSDFKVKANLSQSDDKDKDKKTKFSYKK